MKKREQELLNFNAAFQYMIDLIANGAEYPDAESKAALKFDVDCDALRDQYDMSGIEATA